MTSLLSAGLKAGTLWAVRYRCDCCDAMPDQLQEFPDATLWGRPMRLCGSCVIHFRTKEEIERQALKLTFGIEVDMPAADGLLQVDALDRKFPNPTEAERQALANLRWHFQRRITKNQ